MLEQNILKSKLINIQRLLIIRASLFCFKLKLTYIIIFPTLNSYKSLIQILII